MELHSTDKKLRPDPGTITNSTKIRRVQESKHADGQNVFQISRKHRS